MNKQEKIAVFVVFALTLLALGFFALAYNGTQGRTSENFTIATIVAIFADCVAFIYWVHVRPKTLEEKRERLQAEAYHAQQEQERLLLCQATKRAQEVKDSETLAYPKRTAKEYSKEAIEFFQYPFLPTAIPYHLFKGTQYAYRTLKQSNLRRQRAQEKKENNK